ncbi:MAG: hypothetical protein CMP23_07940 [Rickettsiales bacterium]|nr:hypothetical protein [Rickettsiales bacterium]|tara:strand:- start:397 stop:1875 length:1479 start_codon:yes stop_codon:yes gene_type:complete
MTEHWSGKGDGSTDELSSYEDKDYSEDIQFPVELVDRDGVVRRYSYEESLAVYHRRIQSAPWRLEEAAVVQAEIGHCSRRIDQIKRSFRAQAERPDTKPRRENPRAVLGEGYDILTSFYEKVLRRRQLSLDGSLDMAVSLVQDELDCRLYHLSFGSHQGGHLLYVYPFDRAGDQDPRAAWRQATQHYRRYSGAQVERLLLAAHGEAAGYILTGCEEIPRGLKARIRTHPTGDDAETGEGLIGGAESDPGQGDLWSDSEENEDSRTTWGNAFEQGMEALARDQLSQALQLFQRAVEGNPYQREGYLAILGVLDTLGNYEEANLYGEMARAHLPEDGLICYRLAILLVRQWKHDEALEAFDEAVQLDPSLYQAAFFASHLMLARLQDLDGATRRLRLAAALSEQDAQVLSCLRAAETCRAARRLARGAAIVASAPALTALLAGHLLLGGLTLVASASVLLGAGKVATVLARWAVRRASLAVKEPQGLEDSGPSS